MSRRILLINPPVLAVDLVQLDLYAEAYPYGLLQIATWLTARGEDVQFLDMMGYDLHVDSQASTLTAPRLQTWKRLHIGSAAVSQRPTASVWWYGMSLAELKERLSSMKPADEVWVTCTLNFNRAPAHAVIQTVKRVWPRTLIRFGGGYPGASPELARESGADEVVPGRIAAADGQVPAFGLVDPAPTVGLFRLSNGCNYKCSYCVNSRSEKQVFYPVEKVFAFLEETRSRFGIETFSNWDPNIMLFPDLLGAFLDQAAEHDGSFRYKFEMGVQPNRLDRTWLERMKSAGVESMTIPVESVDPPTLALMRKHYTGMASLRALHTAAELGFRVSRFHCTYIIGFPHDNLRQIFRMHHAILRLGALPCPFPITVVPGSMDHTRHADLIRGKSEEELNGHLWPLLSDRDMLQWYPSLLQVLFMPHTARGASRFERLPPRVVELFEEESELSGAFLAACLDAPSDGHKDLRRVHEHVDALRRPLGARGRRRKRPAGNGSRPWVIAVKGRDVDPSIEQHLVFAARLGLHRRLVESVEHAFGRSPGGQTRAWSSWELRVGGSSFEAEHAATAALRDLGAPQHEGLGRLLARVRTALTGHGGLRGIRFTTFGPGRGTRVVLTAPGHAVEMARLAAAEFSLNERASALHERALKGLALAAQLELDFPFRDNNTNVEMRLVARMGPRLSTLLGPKWRAVAEASERVSWAQACTASKGAGVLRGVFTPGTDAKRAWQLVGGRRASAPVSWLERVEHMDVLPTPTDQRYVWEAARGRSLPDQRGLYLVFRWAGAPRRPLVPRSQAHASGSRLSS